jgi:ketosteroid isomerase-like protein
VSGPDNIAVVREWIRAGNAGDLEAALAVCDPAFEMIESGTLPGAVHVSGEEGLRRYFRGWERNWSEWNWREELIEDVDGDRVLLVSTLWLRGLRSGIGVERRWAYVFTVRDGRLLRQDGYADETEARAALGVSE